MHRAIASWLTQRSWHAALAAAFCGAMAPQMPMPFLLLAGAIPVLMVLRGEERLAFGTTVTASFASVWMLMSLAQPASWTALGIVAVIVSTWALAITWRRTGSPNLCFQLAVLGAALALTAVYALLDDPAALWVERLKLLMASMAQAGIVVDGDVNALVQAWARTMWGALGAMTLSVVLVSLFMGRWWASLLQAPGEFGAEFRQLRLGQALGAGITLLFALALWLDSAWIDSLAWVALAGLAFQGLAAAHRRKARGRLNRGWLAAIYVLLLMPLSTSVTVMVLAIWGFADNWLRSRTGSAGAIGS
jgi:hypothetical protein